MYGLELMGKCCLLSSYNGAPFCLVQGFAEENGNEQSVQCGICPAVPPPSLSKFKVCNRLACCGHAPG